MVASLRGLVLCAAAAGALYAAPAVADKARFVFTPLVPPGSMVTSTYVTGVYQNQAIGYYVNTKDVYAGFAWSAGTYTHIPALGKLSGVSDLGVAVGNTPGSATSYTTYDVSTGVTKIVDFGPTGEYGVAIGGINSSGAIAATALTTVQKKAG